MVFSVGHDGETENLNGASFIYDTDGDSGSDYRLYKDTTFQTLDTFQYEVESLNNSSEPFCFRRLSESTLRRLFRGSSLKERRVTVLAVSAG